MRYFHSNKNFVQYKPPESFWSKLKKRHQKRKLIPNQSSGNILANPFKKGPPKPKSFKKIFITAFILVLFGGWITLMLTLPFFKINKIVITGTKISHPQEIQEYVKYSGYFKNGLVCRQNFFLFPDKTVANKIQEHFLYEKVYIKKVFPNTINITVVEKPASVIFDNNGTIYLLDADGKLIKRTEFSYNTNNQSDISSSSTSTINLINTQVSAYKNVRTEYGEFPIVVDNKTNIQTENLLPKKTIEAAQVWQRLLKEQGIGQVQYFSSTATDFYLKAFVTDKQWYLLINIQNDLQTQIHNLKVILTNNQPTEYVDLRFGERVYWK